MMLVSNTVSHQLSVPWAPEHAFIFWKFEYILFPDRPPHKHRTSYHLWMLYSHAP